MVVQIVLKVASFLRGNKISQFSRKLRKGLRNGFANAIAFTHARNRVRVALKKDGKRVALKKSW